MMKKRTRVFAPLAMMLMALIIAAAGSGCDQNAAEDAGTDRSAQTQETVDMVVELGLTAEAKDASSYTVEVNSAMYSLLDFEDTSEYENATWGLIDAPEVLELKDSNGNVIWNQAAYSFLGDYGEAPDTVNPSRCHPRSGSGSPYRSRAPGRCPPGLQTDHKRDCCECSPTGWG